MSHPFDLHCKHHPERPIDEQQGRWDRLCTECVRKAQNAGARMADASWHQSFGVPYQDEIAPDGRIIHEEMRGDYKRAQKEGSYGN